MAKQKTKTKKAPVWKAQTVAARSAYCVMWLELRGLLPRGAAEAILDGIKTQEKMGV